MIFGLTIIKTDQIKKLTAEHATHTYNLFLVPRRTTLCERILEEEGVFGEVNITSYKLEFIPVEDDLLSLEWENTFREICLVSRMLSTRHYSGELCSFVICLVGWRRDCNILRSPGTYNLPASLRPIPENIRKG